jgi:thiamine biosynthesis protein ThiC
MIKINLIETLIDEGALFKLSNFFYQKWEEVAEIKKNYGIIISGGCWG